MRLLLKKLVLGSVILAFAPVGAAYSFTNKADCMDKCQQKHNKKFCKIKCKAKSAKHKMKNAFGHGSRGGTSNQGFQDPNMHGDGMYSQ